MNLVDIDLRGTCDANGDKTITSTQVVTGYIVKLIWEDGTLASGADGVLTVIDTVNGVDETIFTFTDVAADAQYYPRTLIHGLDKTALTGTAGGDRARIFISGKLKLVISSGGSGGIGGCIVYVEEYE